MILKELFLEPSTYEAETSGVLQSNRSSSLKFVLLFGGLVLLAGLGLLIPLWKPVWLTPPHIEQTSWLYLPIIFGWLIVVLFLALTHRIRMSEARKIVTGVFVLIELAIFVIFIVFWSLYSFKCDPPTSTNGMVDYVCQTTVQGLVPSTDSGGLYETQLEFQGWSGLPIMTLTKMGK